ncbi:MAG: DsbA family protein [Hyphomonadaceae bacterium]
MSLRSLIVPRIAERLTGEARQTSRREAVERKRRASGKPHTVDYFHQADDPYASLVAQILPLLAMRYDIRLRCHLVSAPPDWAAPERARLLAWSRMDAQLLARKASLAFKDTEAQPSAERVASAEAALAAARDAGQFVEEAGAISQALWSGADLPVRDAAVAAAKADGDALRARLGHYLGGTFHYGGEWYWGLDRLHYLEDRLAALGARRPEAPASVIYAQPQTPLPDSKPGPVGEIHYYLSFRSPYTWIAAQRVKALAEAYGLELKLRFVLPMVMRGLPVPPAKRTYIMLDAAREARQAGVPFGRICDPLGRPVERGYSLLPWAMGQGKGFDYCVAFMRAVWSQGVDAGSDTGMRNIVEAAGLDWRAARPLIGNNGWRKEAEANRQELMSLGLWGVPSFRFNDVFAWGQDRLWAVEDAIRAQRT